MNRRARGGRRARYARHRGRDRDEGTIALLVVGFTGVLLLLVAVVVDVSSVVLARRSLVSAADGAAVSAAQALDYPTFYERGATGGVPLSAAGVEARIAAYEQQAATDQRGLQLAGAVDGAYTVVVSATRTVSLPLGGGLGAGSVRVSAQARARAPLTPP